MKTYKDIIGDGGSQILEQVAEHQQKLARRLADVKHIIAVMSGKGGVGKSALTLNLASALALDGHSVGIVDTDINGASIAKMAGVRGQRLRMSSDGVHPAIGDLGINIMSIDLFLPGENNPVIWDAPTQKDAFTWRGMMEANTIREFFADTIWGKLDFLLIDLPPGTDKLPNIVDLLPKISGTLIVTIPSGLSQFVVEKSIKMALDVLQTPVIGLVENMSAIVCESCGKREPLFPSGQSGKLAAAYGIPVLGNIPFDPKMAIAADDGQLYLPANRNQPAAQEIIAIAETVKRFLM